jgi:hypothetical protein
MSIMAFVVTLFVCPAVTLVNQDKEITKPVVPTPTTFLSAKDDGDKTVVLTCYPNTEQQADLVRPRQEIDEENPYDVRNHVNNAHVCTRVWYTSSDL